MMRALAATLVFLGLHPAAARPSVKEVAEWITGRGEPPAVGPGEDPDFETMIEKKAKAAGEKVVTTVMKKATSLQRQMGANAKHDVKDLVKRLAISRRAGSKMIKRHVERKIAEQRAIGEQKLKAKIDKDLAEEDARRAKIGEKITEKAALSGNSSEEKAKRKYKDDLKAQKDLEKEQRDLMRPAREARERARRAAKDKWNAEHGHPKPNSTKSQSFVAQEPLGVMPYGDSDWGIEVVPDSNFSDDMYGFNFSDDMYGFNFSDDMYGGFNFSDDMYGGFNFSDIMGAFNASEDIDWWGALGGANVSDPFQDPFAWGEDPFPEPMAPIPVMHRHA